VAAAECAAEGDCWRVAGLFVLLFVLLLLVVVVVVPGPPTLRASSSPSALFEPVTDLLIGRLTLGDALSPLSSHKDFSSTQSSAPATPSCRESGEKGGGD
jgi:hypothetical protein